MKKIWSSPCCFPRFNTTLFSLRESPPGANLQRTFQQLSAPAGCDTKAVIQVIFHRIPMGMVSTNGTPLKIIMEHKNGGGWKMIFLFKQVLFRFHFNFSGCTLVVWGPAVWDSTGLPFHKEMPGIQTTRPQTTNLSLVDGIFTYNEPIKINHSCEYTSVPWILYLPSLLSNPANCFSVRKEKKRVWFWWTFPSAHEATLCLWTQNNVYKTPHKHPDLLKIPTQPFENHHFIYPSLQRTWQKKTHKIPLSLVQPIKPIDVFPPRTLVLPFISALSSLRSVSKSALSWVFWAIKAKSAWSHTRPRQVAGWEEWGGFGSGVGFFHSENHVFFAVCGNRIWRLSNALSDSSKCNVSDMMWYV